MLKITDFTVEYCNDLLGTDERCPRFSWVAESDRNGARQVRFCLEIISEEGETVWKCDRRSGASVLVEYAGFPLKPCMRYTALVRILDNMGESAQSQLTFETGKLGEEFAGIFIGAEDLAENVDVFETFKNFSCEKKVIRARLYATALGVYNIYLNGKKVGDHYDAPGWTSYHRRVQYQTYDVTDFLCARNELCARVGEGWYKGRLGWDGRKNIYGNRTAFLAELDIRYEDGTRERIVTDTSWKCRSCPLRSSSLYDGDKLDTLFEGGGENQVKEVAYSGKVIAQIGEPVRVTQTLPAISKVITPKGEQVLDFGQNLTGVVRFRIHGKRGQRVSISHAEILDTDGNFYTANLRSAKATDEYVLDGEEQILQPEFTFHGFRYACVEGVEDVEPSDFCALVLHSDMHKTGSFFCADEQIGRLQSNIVWSQRDNFFDIPSDCPQRDERLGWTGDANVFCRTASFNYNVVTFFSKWLGDLALDQTMSYGVPHVVPNILGEYLTASSCWGDAATVIPWTMYTVYGDKRILERQYESMKQWVEYMRAHADHGLWKSGFQYGDWLALDKEEFSDRTGATDKYMIASAWYAVSTKIVAEASRILGKKEEQAEYFRLYKSILRAFRREYITATGRAVSETQTALVILLHFGLIQPKFRKQTAVALERNIHDHYDHLVTGFVGTPYLCLTLSENGQHALAAKLLYNTDYPSWLYEVERGATTIWERWNAVQPDGSLFEPSMSSFNHYAYGSIGDWLYRKVAGIDCLAAGYKKLLFCPRPVRALGNFGARYITPYGEAAIFCTYREGKILWDIRVPFNTQAKIVLPDGQTLQVGSGTYKLISEESKCTIV